MGDPGEGRSGRGGTTLGLFTQIGWGVKILMWRQEWTGPLFMLSIGLHVKIDTCASKF